MVWRAFLTDVGCLDVQKVAFTNQSGATTNQIGRSEGLGITLDKGKQHLGNIAMARKRRIKFKIFLSFATERRVRGQVTESAAVLVLQRAALHDKPVGLSLDKVLHVQRGHFTFLIAYLHGLICNTTYFSDKIYFIGKVSTTSRAK